MTNNDILRRLRYTFDFNDSKMIAVFGLADHQVTRAQVSSWLKTTPIQIINHVMTPPLLCS